MPRKFPSTLYVTHEGDNDDPYLNAAGEQPSVDETTPVAVYKLVEIGDVVVTREFASRPKRRR